MKTTRVLQAFSIVLAVVAAGLFARKACVTDGSQPFKNIDITRQTPLLFDLEGIADRFDNDPQAHLILRPYLEWTSEWPEHPRGQFTVRTNNLGFRENEDTELVTKGLRVLITGDSHTAGVVANEETFANLLESRLSTRGYQGLDILNAGVPFTGPSCYLGMIRKHLALDPDLVIPVVFSGNDFWDDLKIQYLLAGSNPPLGDRDYMQRIGSAVKKRKGPIFQGLNQCYRWKHFPLERQQALNAVVDSFLSIRDLCDSYGIELLIVILPTKMDVEPHDDAETQTAAIDILDLSPQEVTANRTMAEELGKILRDAGIRCFDPYHAMVASPRPLYWRRDYHLSVNGHLLLAELLEPEVHKILQGL